MKIGKRDPNSPQAFGAVMAHLGAMSPEELDRYIVRMPEGAVEMETMLPRPDSRIDKVDSERANGASLTPRSPRVAGRVKREVKVGS